MQKRAKEKTKLSEFRHCPSSDRSARIECGSWSSLERATVKQLIPSHLFPPNPAHLPISAYLEIVSTLRVLIRPTQRSIILIQLSRSSLAVHFRSAKEPQPVYSVRNSRFYFEFIYFLIVALAQTGLCDSSAVNFEFAVVFRTHPTDYSAAVVPNLKPKFMFVVASLSPGL